MVYRQVTIGDILAGKYRVDRELGAGGMGVVYAAWHLELDHPVAIKVVTAQVADLPAASVRFRREVRAAAKIRSEHVARVLDVGTLENALPYMVLELLEGNDLDQELTRRGQLPVIEAVDYVLQAIEAISEAHAAGIIHRDLKPANLFLAERADRTRIIKVLDFGISKSLLAESAPGHVSLTQTGMMMGSPLYMSPEQMQSGRDADSRCDVWALGVVLYQLLTGTTPFRGNSIVELCAAIFGGNPSSLGELRPDVPVALEQAILKCLERDREQRHQNVAGLALAIVDFGSPESRIHCERALRVLDPSGTMRSSLTPLRTAAPLALGANTYQKKEDAIRAAASLLEQSPSTGGALAPETVAPLLPEIAPGTHVAWNSTNSVSRGRGRGRTYLLLGAALLALGAAAVFVGVTRTGTGLARGSASQTYPNDHLEAPATTSPVAAALVQSTPLTAEVTAVPSGSVGTEPSGPTLHPVQPTVVAPAIARAVVKPVNSKSTASKATQAKTGAVDPQRTHTGTANESAGRALPDYGGRR